MKMKIGFSIAATAMLLAGCTQPQPDVAEQLSGYGMTNVQTDGYDFFACGRDDTFATRFKAFNSQGMPVSGVLCSGWFKGGTVRNLRVKQVRGN